MNGVASTMSETIAFEETVNALISVLSNVYCGGQEDIKRVGDTFRVGDATVTESVLAAMVMEPDLIPDEYCRSSEVLSFRDYPSEDMYNLNDAQPVEASTVEPKLLELASDPCIEFCDSRGLSSVLAACLTKAKEIFSTIVKLSAELDYFRDDQAQNTEHVVIRVEVNSDQQTALREYDRWIRWMATNVAPSDSDFFTLTVRRV